MRHTGSDSERGAAGALHGAPHVAGRNAVRELLEGADVSRVDKVLFAQQKQGARGGRSSGGSSADASGSLGVIRALADERSVTVQYVPHGKLNSLVPGVNHQGVVAVVSPISYLDADDMLSAIAPTRDDVVAKKPIIVLLDHIQDPHNLGAIARSAVAAGAAGLVLPDRGAAPVTAASVKTSAGMLTQLPVARTHNLKLVIEGMKERGYWIAGAEGSGATSMWDMDWDRPLGIVIGSEEKGMMPTVRALCDYEVSIPMPGPAESLNASVAAAILLFQATRCRL